jgi:hypothetical protein
LNPEVVATNLRVLERQLRSILEDESRRNIMEAASNAQSYRSRLSGHQLSRSQIGQPPWRVYIDSENSMRFKPSELDSRLAPDIFCDIQGPTDPNWPLSKQNLVIQIWSLDKSLSFRDEWDSGRVSTSLVESSARVMLRLHFDRSDPNLEAPVFHLQIGGRSRNPQRELCWFPETMDLPRLLYPPIDLVLASEVVVANFFPRTFRRLLDTGEWTSLVNSSEAFLLENFYRKCHIECNQGSRSGRTLFDCWWQHCTG